MTPPKKLSDTMVWAAASVPFELLKAMPKQLAALKAMMDGFHNPPTAEYGKDLNRPQGGRYANAVEKRAGEFKIAFDSARNAASKASSGLLSASLIEGPRAIQDVVSKMQNFASGVGHGLDAIQRTLPDKMFDGYGRLESEHLAAVLIAASRMLAITIADIEARVKDAETKSEGLDTAR